MSVPGIGKHELFPMQATDTVAHGEGDMDPGTGKLSTQDAQSKAQMFHHVLSFWTPFISKQVSPR